jgi:two-component system, OmpR family, alkaline phosphatase synthesis response regulator PhoP
MNNSDFRILLVDDEPDVLEFLSYNLRKEGYVIDTASNGKDAIIKAIEKLPQLIVLDVMMPEMDGIETCRELKKIEKLAGSLIVFLTARSEDYSQLSGFDAGADDYIAKPVKPSVFISKIKAMLRRYSAISASVGKIIELDNIIIDRERFLVIIDNNEIVLPRKEFQLLELLASKPNRVFTRDEIFSVIWGNTVIVGDRTIDVHIRKIREKIGIDNIKTIKGIGYKYEL